jgi:hypothetical protein
LFAKKGTKKRVMRRTKKKTAKRRMKRRYSYTQVFHLLNFIYGNK